MFECCTFRVGPEQVTHWAIMRHLLLPIYGADLHTHTQTSARSIYVNVERWVVLADKAHAKDTLPTETYIESANQARVNQQNVVASYCMLVYLV